MKKVCWCCKGTGLVECDEREYTCPVCCGWGEIEILKKGDGKNEK